jgi:hypothetical protein
MWVPLSSVALSPLLVLAVAVAACSSPTASTDAYAPIATNPAELKGTTLDGLRNAGWDCQPRGALGTISCAPPGIGLPPIPPLGEAGRPVYQLAVFQPDGTPFGTAHFLRADLYHGQTCAFTGQPFVLRAIIGYYECLRVY